ncbi:MAG: RdgB/HAM1 family non-canonical purine NTP pyrophosphatase [Acidobacteriota bacterium]|nr:RdgB/HAM1 family non-canonical purine NTP pyrophosphatase [Acidobacteriota bacterium]
MSILLYACSTNEGKLHEFELAAREIVGTPVYRMASLPRLKQITPPEETGATFEANAALKAAYYSAFTPELVFADDSGLEVDALGGKPGVHSARFAGTGASDTQNNARLLSCLQASSNRRARFVCVVALARAGNVLSSFRGAVEGEILLEPVGNDGFGYDPLFLYPPWNKSFAEISPERKFHLSHRGQALRKLFEHLRTGRLSNSTLHSGQNQ